jgi:hypothetical protein
MPISKEEIQRRLKEAEEVSSLDELLDDIQPTEKKPRSPRQPSTSRPGKGVNVAFYNQKGQLIAAPGVLYYVTRMDGRLHYKEASQVTMLPADWQPGDPIAPSLMDKIAGKPTENFEQELNNLEEEDDLL